MRQEAFAKFTMMSLPTIGLVLFVVLFVSLIWWVSRNDSKKLYGKVDKFPLEDGVRGEKYE
jgi:cbb3-type cytochrome oxidase subunit 3